jgi:hypothetical protein
MYSLGRQFPGLCGCLAKTKAGRDKCLICEEKLKTDIEECYNEECKFVYCEECWQDVKVGTVILEIWTLFAEQVIDFKKIHHYVAQ